MRIKSKTILNFLSDFEDSFGSYLTIPKRQSGAISIKHFTVYPAKHKYSDWDIKCRLKNGIRKEILTEMINFIKSYSDFDCVGNFVTNSPRYIDEGHKINQPNAIQMMGFMTSEKWAPFFDISILNVAESLNEKLFKKKYNQDFLIWSLLTAWRKLRNNYFTGVNSFIWIMYIFVLPQYTKKQDKKTLLSKPEYFFKKEIVATRYKPVLDFLRRK